MSASLQRSSERRRNRDKVGLPAVQTVKDRFRAGQGFKTRGSVLQLHATLSQLPPLIYWLIVKKQRDFCGIDARCLRFYMKVGSGEEPVSGSVFAARR